MKRTILAYLLAGLILNTQVLFSQDDIEEDEEVFELSPFEVSVANDQGYLSTNAISGTSLNTAIRDLPMPLEVINRELIEDLQATDLEESLEYSAGVYTQSFENSAGANEGGFADSSPSNTNLNSDFTNVISLRGYTVPNNQRFGFRVGAIVPRYNVVLGGSTDTVTTERIEVVRGPQALLYGINVLSGIVNIIPKEPLFDPAYRLNLSVGSYGFRRASIDATGPVIKQRLAYRFLAGYTEEDHWTMFQQTEKEDYALQFKWRITPKYDLFVEAKKSNYHRQGIGPQYFVDNDSTGSSGFRWENEWNELMTFGRDIIDAPLVSDLGNVHESPWVPRSDVEYPDKLYDYGPYYRISGPDTYFDREEVTITALLRAKFSENLSGEFGIYHVEQEEDTRNVDLRTFNGSRGPVRPTFAPKDFFGRPPTEKQITQAMHIWFNNPEVNLNGTRGPLDVYGDEEYLLSKGLGEVFVFPTYADNPGYPKTIPQEDPQDYSDPTSQNFDRRFARYAWYTDKNDAESTQLRARLAYNFDWDPFGIDANHTFSVGANYIGDIVDFNDAWIAANNDNYIYSSNQPNPEDHRQDEDPYYFRQSVLDMTPMRYNGETVALLANPNFNRLADFRTGGTGGGDDGASIARSGKREATLWYRGFYGLYQGNFMNDKLHFIGGMREDQYQVKETEQLIILDQARVSDVWQGSVDPITPWYIGDGRGEYKSPDGIPDELDARVRADYARLQELQPEGTTEYNFDDYQKFQTGTAGFSFRIIDPISVYYLYSEGVFPNTGQRDGNYDPIDAEQTVNNEIGLKFDLLDGKISGTISFYKIERENAVFYWRWAPAPHTWHGGLNPPIDPSNIAGFSPDAATAAGSAYIGGKYLPVTYGVAVDWVEEAFKRMGMEDEFPFINGAFPPSAFEKWAPGSQVEGRGIHGGIPGAGGQTYLYARINELDSPNGEVIKLAFEIAQNEEAPLGSPFYYWSSNDVINNNPSNQAGANVTFGEEGKGVDGQIIFTPIPNYQIIFSYSYQNREVTSFHMVDAVDLNTGINWGTEYDAWVYFLGVDNFEDPTRASTFNGGSIRGTDLSFVPQISGKIWNMYRFTDGPFDGLRIGGGVQYIGSAPTAVAIGGQELSENRYLTPDTPERFIFDASVSYKWSWGDIDWFLSLRIANLLDDRTDSVQVSYDTAIDTVQTRRTRVYYDPRTWRLSLTARF